MEPIWNRPEGTAVSKKLRLRIIAAVDLSGAYGIDNDLPWKLYKDLAAFKHQTMHFPCIMGRKTWESIPRTNKKRVKLPGRLTIVVSRTMTDPKGQGTIEEPARVAKSFEEAIEIANKVSDIAYVCGGKSMWDAALNHDQLECMLLTHVLASTLRAEGPIHRWKPPIDSADWSTIAGWPERLAPQDSAPPTFEETGMLSDAHFVRMTWTKRRTKCS